MKLRMLVAGGLMCGLAVLAGCGGFTFDKCQIDPTFPGCPPTPPPTPPPPPPCPCGWSTAKVGTCAECPPPMPVPTPQPTPTPVPTPTPTPHPLGCQAPQGMQWSGPGQVTTSAGPLVNKAMAELLGCRAGSDCPHGEGPGEAAAQRWMARVIAELRLRGLCAGQHEAGITDEIAVATQCEGPWEGYHVANYGGGKVVWSPGAARPSWTPTAGCSSPLPTPTPPPTPGPTPSPGVCPAPTPGPLSKWEAKIHNRGPNWTTLDSTPLVGPDQDFCRAIGYTDGRRFCPPRAEGTAEAEIRACNELVVGPRPYPLWFWNGQRVPPEGLEGVIHDDNPYHLLVRPQLHGTADVCGQNDTCGRVIL